MTSEEGGGVADATGAITPTIDVFVTAEEWESDLVESARRGLASDPKVLSPVWFYDDLGSSLFDQITRLPEYYLTRAERRLLEGFSPEIAEIAGADMIVELGAGTCEKSRVLLDAFSSAGTLRKYVPLDVSESTLWTAAQEIAAEYPGLAVHAIVGDFQRHLGKLPRSGGRRLLGFLGSTIGNLAPAERAGFLAAVAGVMGAGDTLLLGTDLVKEPERLLAAYDDSAGVTAEFNRNVLRVLDARLGATFDPDGFEHVAYWNAADAWIEMRLRSLADQRVRVERLDLDLSFAEGEDLRTEISAKFTRAGVTSELGAAGLEVAGMWEDPEGFLLTLAVQPG